MARVASKDPLDKYRWAVSIDGFTKLGFTACETPSITINTKSYPEGGNHLYPRKIVDGAEYTPVIFTRGVTKDKSFHDWISQVLEAYKLDKNVNDYRRQVTIHHLDRQGRIVKSYVLYNAFPIEYKPASDFASDADDTLSLEKLVLTYESFEVITNNTDSNPFDARDIFKRLVNRN
jgi:phage tail-like protein